MESTDMQRLGKSSPNGKCGTNRNTSRLSFPEAAARRVDFLSCTRSAGSRAHPSNMPVSPAARNPPATKLCFQSKCHLSPLPERSPISEDRRARQPSTRNSGQMPGISDRTMFRQSLRRTSRKSRVAKSQTVNRPRVATLSPPSALCAPYLLLCGQVPGIPDPAPFGRSVRSTCPAGRGFRQAAG